MKILAIIVSVVIFSMLLFLQELPEGNWYCSRCSCWSCGNLVGNNEAPISGVPKCLMCKHKCNVLHLFSRSYENVNFSHDPNSILVYLLGGGSHILYTFLS